MKEFAQKTKKNSINIHRTNQIDRMPSTALVKPATQCQPKQQPNVLHFTHLAHPRRDEYKENIRMKDNETQMASNRHVKGNVLLKDKDKERKSHQSTHEDPMRKTMKKLKVRDDRPVKGKTEWVSVEEQGNLGCNENLNSQIFRPGLSRSGRSFNRTAQAIQESVI